MILKNWRLIQLQTAMVRLREGKRRIKQSTNGKTSLLVKKRPCRTPSLFDEDFQEFVKKCSSYSVGPMLSLKPLRGWQLRFGLSPVRAHSQKFRFCDDVVSHTPYFKMAANELFFFLHVDQPPLPHFYFKILLCFIQADEAQRAN